MKVGPRCSGHKSPLLSPLLLSVPGLMLAASTCCREQQPTYTVQEYCDKIIYQYLVRSCCKARRRVALPSSNMPDIQMYRVLLVARCIFVAAKGLETFVVVQHNADASPKYEEVGPEMFGNDPETGKVGTYMTC